MITAQDVLEAGPKPFLNWLKQQPEDRRFNIYRGCWPKNNYSDAPLCPFASYLSEMVEGGQIGFNYLYLDQDETTFADLSRSWMYTAQKDWENLENNRNLSLSDVFSIFPEEWVNNE